MCKNPATAWSNFSERLLLSTMHFAEDKTSTLMTSLAQEQLALVSGGVNVVHAPQGDYYTEGFGVPVGIDDYNLQVCRPLIP
jgi:hypothetical protein